MTRSRFAILFVAILSLSALAPMGGAAVEASPHSHGDTGCDFPVTLTDGSGTEVTVSERPERVIVLGGSAAQTTWEIGAEDRVVGIDAFSTYLEGASAVPIVSGGIGRVDYEAALNQSPDLIIVAGNSYDASVADQFRRSNVSTFLMPDAGSIEGIYSKTHTFGQLLGACESAHSVVSDMRDRVETVRTAVNGETEPSAFVDLGGVRDAAERYSAGPGSFIGAAVDTAGATNIVANGNFESPFPQVSNEFILSQNPEFIVVTYTPGSSFGAATPEEARAAIRNTSVFAETEAVTEDNIVAVNANNLSQPAPRIVSALETLVKSFHPEAYEMASSTTTSTTTATETQPPTTSATTPTTTETSTPTPTQTSGDSGPGFGFITVVLAIVLTLIVSRRPIA